MNGDEWGSPVDGEPLVRPFLYRGPTDPAPGTAVGAEPQAEVRPYLITGGRTGATSVNVAMETVVVVCDRARDGSSGRIAFEHAAVLAECARPRSAAEIAARLRLPLMVALVLVSDLVSGGLLEASATTARQTDDVAFLERLIDGVTAL